jgi:hypothetical protein
VADALTNLEREIAATFAAEEEARRRRAVLESVRDELRLARQRVPVIGLAPPMPLNGSASSRIQSDGWPARARSKLVVAESGSWFPVRPSDATSS